MKKNRPFKKINTGLLIRIDDISSHMNWNLMNKCEELFNKHNIKPLLGVIPNNEDEEILKYEKKENFWDGFDKCVHELAPKNKELLEIREKLQGSIDSWHKDKKNEEFDNKEYKQFLEKIGY